jgi:hypothetical protein
MNSDMNADTKEGNLTPDKRKRGNFFGSKATKDKRRSDKEVDDEVLDYDLLYPLNNDEHIDNPKGNHLNGEFMDTNEDNRSDSDVEVDKRKRGYFFGGKTSRDKPSKDRGDNAMLNYDSLYRLNKDKRLTDNPKDLKKKNSREVMHSNEEFSIDGNSSDSDIERDSRNRYHSRDNFDGVNPNHRRAKNSQFNSTSAKEEEEGSHRPGVPKSYIGSQECTSQGYPNVFTAYTGGTKTEHVQCVIIRDRSGIQAKMYPTYELRLEETNQKLIVAQKMNLNRTSNYHLFDMTRGLVGKHLSKKSGNYMGKLRAKNIQRTEYILLNQASEREEVAGFMFDRLDVIGNIKEGSQPRKLSVILPRIDSEGNPVPNCITDNGNENSIIDMLQATSSSERHGMHLFETKEPVFINGNFRLNFNGRVSIPSVKNFQLVSDDDIDDIVCQFGKIDDDKYHLDFKAPFNAFQAFSLALSQFNL